MIDVRQIASIIPSSSWSSSSINRGSLIDYLPRSSLGLPISLPITQEWPIVCRSLGCPALLPPHPLRLILVQRLSRESIEGIFSRSSSMNSYTLRFPRRSFGRCSGHSPDNEGEDEDEDPWDPSRATERSKWIRRGLCARFLIYVVPAAPDPLNWNIKRSQSSAREWQCH